MLLASAELFGLAGLAPWAIVVGNGVGMAWLAIALRQAMNRPIEPPLVLPQALERVS